nr:IS110 family transposase [Candidatus Sigynarchaeota archaeon]
WKETTFYCGLDVHKYQLAAAIYARDDSGNEFSKCELFRTDSAALKMFFSFVKTYRPSKFGMEATNVYHHVVATFLERMKEKVNWSYDVLVFNPGDATSIPGRQKNDPVVALAIARYLAAGLLKTGKPVVVALEDMRAIFRTAARVEVDRTALKNRIKKSMDRGGFRPTGFDLNTNWARDFVYHLTDHDGTVGAFLDKCFASGGPLDVHAKIIERNKAKFDPYKDIILTEGQKAVIRQDLVDLEFKTARNALLAVEIDKLVALRPGLKQVIENIASVPGITPYSAAWLVAEIGHASLYPNVRHFLAYCGCAPRVMMSSNKVYTAHVSRRSNKFVRTIFFNAAKVVCFVVKKDSALKQYATKVVNRKRDRGMSLPACIVAAKIARIVYAILRDNTQFMPTMAKNSAIDFSPGRNLSITDRSMLKRARNCLKRVAELKELKLISKHAKYFSDALDRALREN